MHMILKRLYMTFFLWPPFTKNGISMHSWCSSLWVVGGFLAGSLPVSPAQCSPRACSSTGLAFPGFLPVDNMSPHAAWGWSIGGKEVGGGGRIGGKKEREKWRKGRREVKGMGKERWREEGKRGRGSGGERSKVKGDRINSISPTYHFNLSA